ncbi:hypothetical protein K501DRAFT_280004 [Backusella circina FSU 941]|nr:hypothetical protein K501DRAFT_280004 [Backusella circina FSU 941]
MATVSEDPLSSSSSQQEDIETIIKTSLDQNKDQQIAAILVVGFHHAYGPIVEFCVPPLPYHHNQSAQVTLEKLELPEEWSFLPFLALPGIFRVEKKNHRLIYFLYKLPSGYIKLFDRNEGRLFWKRRQQKYKNSLHSSSPRGLRTLLELSGPYSL